LATAAAAEFYALAENQPEKKFFDYSAKPSGASSPPPKKSVRGV